MTFRIVATARSFCNTPGEHQDLLRAAGCELELRAPSHQLTADELRPLVAGVDGLILGLDRCDASVIAAANVLKVIARTGVGVDEVDLEAASARGIAVTITPGANSDAVAELTIGFIFALARSIPRVASAAARGEWLRPAAYEIGGKTLGVIGLGAIGRGVAKRALGLGLRVVGYDPIAGDVPDVERVSIPNLLAQSDIVSLHVPLTPETRNLIDAAALATMRDGAALINTARGGLVDEDALYAALKSGKLSGAAMDAFQTEPPVGSPLLTLDNFIAAPHIGANTREAALKMSLMAAQNCLAVLRGEPCPYIINLKNS
ncbi:MAG: phosphoglycerate dehydrogenase [Chloroflexota bacterium]|nr:phosphoglycerate dehydrogenase [Chloroflexota bacterium]